MLKDVLGNIEKSHTTGEYVCVVPGEKTLSIHPRLVREHGLIRGQKVQGKASFYLVPIRGRHGQLVELN